MSTTVTSPATNPLRYLHDQIADLEAKGLPFRLRVLEGEQKPEATFDGKQVINLSSNNYLGFTTHKALKRAAIEAVRTYGAGAGAVRTISGTMSIQVQNVALVASREFSDIVRQRLCKAEQIPKWNELTERNQMDFVVAGPPIAFWKNQLRRVEHLGPVSNLPTHSQAACNYIRMRILGQRAQPMLELLIRGIERRRRLRPYD